MAVAWKEFHLVVGVSRLVGILSILEAVFFPFGSDKTDPVVARSPDHRGDVGGGDTFYQDLLLGGQGQQCGQIKGVGDCLPFYFVEESMARPRVAGRQNWDGLI